MGLVARRETWFRLKRDRSIQPKSSDEIRRLRHQQRRERLAARRAEQQLSLLREPLHCLVSAGTP